MYDFKFPSHLSSSSCKTQCNKQEMRVSNNSQQQQALPLTLPETKKVRPMNIGHSQEETAVKIPTIHFSGAFAA